MEPARVSTLLDHGWSIVGQLHQWLSTSRHEFHDRDELVVLIRELQTFWGRVDDLELKRFARNTLALEQFFESLCAKRLEVTPGHLDDLQAGIACFEDLLLGFEATGEEPKMTQLDLLSRLEQHPRQQRSSERPTRTIEVDVINHDRQLEAASTDLIEVPSPRPIKLPQRIANTTRASQRLEQKVVPRIEPFIFTRFENPDVSPPQEVAASPLGEQDLEDSVVESGPDPRRVAVLSASHADRIALCGIRYRDARTCNGKCDRVERGIAGPLWSHSRDSLQFLGDGVTDPADTESAKRESDWPDGNGSRRSVRR